MARPRRPPARAVRRAGGRGVLGARVRAAARARAAADREDYARAVIGAALVKDPAEIERRATARMFRARPGMVGVVRNGGRSTGQEPGMRREDDRYIDTEDEPDFAEEWTPSATDPPNAEPDDKKPDERWDKPTEV